MRRVPVLVSLSVAVLIVVGLVAAGRLGRGAVAQDADHPVVGAWVTESDVDDPSNPPALAVFHADGTFLDLGTTHPGAGAWEATGERTATLTSVLPAPAEGGRYSGVATIRGTLEVAEDGQSFTVEFTFELVQTDGTTTGEIGPGTTTGTRIAVEEPGEPVGSFEAPAATPE